MGVPSRFIFLKVYTAFISVISTSIEVDVSLNWWPKYLLCLMSEQITRNTPQGMNVLLHVVERVGVVWSLQEILPWIFFNVLITTPWLETSCYMSQFCHKSLEVFFFLMVAMAISNAEKRVKYPWTVQCFQMRHTPSCFIGQAYYLLFFLCKKVLFFIYRGKKCFTVKNW